MTDNLPTLAAPTLEERAQAHENEALALLVETIRDPTVKREHRIKAAEAVLDRARGRPRQPQAKDPSQPKRRAVQMSVETLLKIVQKSSERVAHADAVRREATVLEGEFTPSPRKRPVNEYAQLPAIVPGTSEEVEDLLS